MRKFSKKRDRINRAQYIPQARQFVIDNPLCKINAPGCHIETQGVHHMKGKSTIELLLDIRFWKPSCNYCNLYVETHDAWAREKGLKLSKFN